MNRRDVLKFAAVFPFLRTAEADCRDERGMIQPESSGDCLALTIRKDLSGKSRVARATFGFGAYEPLLQLQESRTGTAEFEFEGNTYRMVVSRVSVDVDRQIGCVVAVADGAIWSVS